jgi:uncharacterized protein (DUF1800 family)
VADGGRIDGRTEIPKTGRFIYVDSWHDGYQKRVLATEFDPFQKAMHDGRRVLDLVAAHPATARHIATKLCGRLICDVPPPRIAEEATQAWLRHRDAPDQIARVLEVILLSPEFAHPPARKVKRPMALAAGFARAAGMDFVPTEGLAGQIANAGQRMFGWPTPLGPPNTTEAVITSNSLRHRWLLVAGLAANTWGNGSVPNDAMGLSSGTTPRDLVADWLERLSGSADDRELESVLKHMPSPVKTLLGDPAGPLAQGAARQLIATCAMAPSFQTS